MWWCKLGKFTAVAKLFGRLGRRLADGLDVQEEEQRSDGELRVPKLQAMNYCVLPQASRVSSVKAACQVVRNMSMQMVLARR